MWNLVRVGAQYSLLIAAHLECAYTSPHNFISITHCSRQIYGVSPVMLILGIICKQHELLIQGMAKDFSVELENSKELLERHC